MDDAVVVAELVTEDAVVAGELVLLEVELLEPDEVDGAELAGVDEVVGGGCCERVVVGELGCVDPDSGSTYC